MIDHEFTVGGVRQVYHVAGDGPLCVAHPGGPGLHWSYLRSPELEELFTMVYVEPVGTGASGRPAAYGLETYVRFLGAVVDRLGPEPVYVLGHSYGGFVAQSYALAHRDRVAGLILYSTAPTNGPEWSADASAALAGVPSGPELFGKAVAAIPDGDDVLSTAFAAAVPVYFADFGGRRASYAPWQASVRMYAEPAGAPEPEPFDARARLGELTVPTVVIGGRHDFMCGPAWTARLAEGIPGARLHMLEHSGHFGHVEQPSEFRAAAAEVLNP